MATILIVDDRPTNREVLVTLLGYKGHRLVEAADGAEALERARMELPDLIISDILMPTMDGYELVNQLRAEPALARIPVIFYTAHYLQNEAETLARRCGVTHILTKPSKPAVVLSTVEAALASALPPAAVPPAEEFEREHRRLITNKLSQKVNELRRVNKQLSKLIGLNLQLVSERDSQQLLQNFCQAARELVGAKYAAVSIHSKDAPAQRYFFTSGLEAEVAAQLSAAPFPLDTLAPLPAQHHPYHLRNYSGDPEMAGFPSVYPPFHTLLTTPIISSSQSYGWFCLFDKVGAEEFNASDEQAAILLATLVGRLYENRQLYAEVQRRSEELEQEVAERKRAEEELKQTAAELARSNAELEQFAYVTSHDLQEPLRVVAGMVQLLQKRYTGQLDTRADEFIQHAVDGTTRMRTLITDLLTYSRVGTRSQPLQQTDISVILQDALANLAVAVRESRAVITHDPLPTLMADRTQLTQLFQNLIGNAIKFCGDKAPVIHIGAECKTDEWLFAVRDHGIGMEAQHFERIFGVFQRLHTRQEYTGTGIGLAICKKIVELHGGRIWVESEVGQGSTFYFILPDGSRHEAAAHP